MSYKNGYRFKNRYLITGQLTVRTPLHIGSGDITQHDKLKVDDNEFIEIAAVAKAVKNKEGKNQLKPYIPASTLKGNLRAWLETRVKEKSLLEKLFGASHQTKNAEGGKAEFWDAYLAEAEDWDAYLAEAEELTETETETQFPYWNPETQTGVQVGVTIDRRTRSARDKRLFYWEVVPPGVTFKVRITGQDLEDEEIALLLANLEGFNDQRPVCLGSETAQNQGKMRWHSFNVQRLEAAQAIAWLNNPDDQGDMWSKGLQSLDRQTEATLIKMGQQLIYKESTRPTLRLQMRLQFDSPFLVNDPSKKEAKGEPDFQPRCDATGRVLLPAKSMRGAIRSQAERIIRTLGGHACWIDDVKFACKPVQEIKAVNDDNLCLACQLFGATGWQTPIRMSDFTFVHSQGENFEQDFVAIDRFTGGGCEGAKFKAKASNAPLLEGTWEIDLQRVEPWGLGLLALVIRDLMEADITFGYGAAKGYGRARLLLGFNDHSINTLENCFTEDVVDWQGLDPAMPQEWPNNMALLQTFIQQELVQAFRQKCQQSQTQTGEC
jgi:CRISPR/Cas system CSM-associated protein Csm3 (group 7 of RAMP superfamily)